MKTLWIAIAFSCCCGALEISELQLKNVKAESVTFKGRKAIRLTDASPETPDGARLAFISKTDFHDGVIEIDIAGDTLPGAAAEFRGFHGHRVSGVFRRLEV